MWRTLSTARRIGYHRRWIRAIVKDETPESIREHIIKHASEIYHKAPQDWSASMRNLIDIFDEMNQSRPSVELRLEKLEAKHKKNSRRYTPPPKIGAA